MRDPLVVGLAAITAIALVPVLLWLFLAAVVSNVGCAWILGLGGCLPRWDVVGGTGLEPVTSSV